MQLERDLHRLAGFGLNITDAHSCFIFVPPQILSTDFEAPLSEPQKELSYRSGSTPHLENSQFIEVAGVSTLSQEIIEHCKIFLDSGLIGWVAKHGRSIHVSPFEHDSRTLGVYSADQQLKSFLGIPISLSEPDTSGRSALTGVIACDSKKSFAFSKLQGKLLEDLAREVANTVALHQRTQETTARQPTWDAFLESACTLGHSLGVLSLEIMRIRQIGFENLEMTIGTMKAIDLTRQAHRLIQQALPPLYPSLVLPNGDMVIALDTMMSSLIENKVRALCGHLSGDGAAIEFEFIKNPIRKRKERSVHLDTLVAETAPRPIKTTGEKTLNYEYRRA